MNSKCKSSHSKSKWTNIGLKSLDIIRIKSISMILHLFFLLIRQFRACSSPNTVLSFTGKCVCIDGFPYGDPTSKEGCYKCDRKCHPLATCNFPGSCTCPQLYLGDGITSCQRNIPKIKSIYPLSGPSTGGTVVTINYEYSLSDDEVVDKAFCQFGSLIVNAENVTNSTITCISPPHNPTPAFVSILFDPLVKSQDEVFFEYENVNQSITRTPKCRTFISREKQKDSGFVYLLIICAVMLIAFYLAMTNRGSTTQLPQALQFRSKRRSFWQ